MDDINLEFFFISSPKFWRHNSDECKCCISLVKEWQRFYYQEEVFLTEEVEVDIDLTLEKHIVSCVGDQVILLTNVTIGLIEIFNVFPVKILAEEDYLNLQELIS